MDTHKDMPVKPELINISELVINTEISGWLWAEEVQNRTTTANRPGSELLLGRETKRLGAGPRHPRGAYRW